MISPDIFETTFTVTGGFENAGRVSSRVKALLAQRNLPKSIIRRASIVTLEAEMNICSYADRGTITLRLNPHFVIIEAVDEGQGIGDVEAAMVEGFSTATDKIRSLGFGAGLGLSNMKRFSDTFRIVSEVGKGTRLRMLIHIPEHVDNNT
ncbi:MAG: ATP-binding protein [Syntrophorhabdaceae bacterium]